MNRREFIGAASGGLCLPSYVLAQPDRIRRIGWLDSGSANQNLAIFEGAMAARGWIKGRTFSLDYRSGEGRAERLAAVTAKLIRLPADVIVAPGIAESPRRTRPGPSQS